MTFIINKGINEPLIFLGLVGGRYAIRLVVGLGLLVPGFVVAFAVGLNTFLAIFLVVGAGLGWTSYVFQLSAKYGQHGAMKQAAKQRQPLRIVNRDPHLFQNLKR